MSTQYQSSLSFVKALVSVLFLVVFVSASNAQVASDAQVASNTQVEIVTVDELNARILFPSDTTFVVNLWATWCRPCVAELPFFERLSRELPASRNVKVLLVSVDAKRDRETKLARFLTMRGITAEVVLLSPVVVDSVNTSWSGAIPATLFVKGSKRGFFEQEFTYDELNRTLDDFIKSATKP